MGDSRIIPTDSQGLYHVVNQTRNGIKINPGLPASNRRPYPEQPGLTDLFS
jgi:hypothetical protein